MIYVFAGRYEREHDALRDTLWRARAENIGRPRAVDAVLMKDGYWRVRVRGTDPWLDAPLQAS